MNYSLIVNQEVKLCLPSATVTVLFFFFLKFLTGKLELLQREKGDDQSIFRDCVFVTQGSMLVNQNQGHYSGSAVLVRSQDGHVKNRHWKGRPQRHRKDKRGVNILKRG